MTKKKWLWALALLPLVCVSLIAQQPQAGDSQSQPADEASAEVAEDDPEPAAEQQPRPPDEEVSADNNLSFPVDI